MSTKKLSRSVSEGGRSNKKYRKLSQSSYRASERQYLNDVSSDIDNYYDYDIEPRENQRDYSGCKISPVRRWINKQIGRVWNDVYSEIVQKFNNSIIDGRGIKDYLKWMVDVNEDPSDIKYGLDHTTSSRRGQFYVDDDGILRNKKYVSPHWRRKLPKFDTTKIASWLNGRVVGKVGNKLFFFCPIDGNHKRFSKQKQWKTEWKNGGYSYLTWLYMYETPIYSKEKNELGTYDKKWQPAFIPNFKQDRALNKEELQFWNSIPEWFQTKVLERSPTYPNPTKFRLGSYEYYQYYGI